MKLWLMLVFLIFLFASGSFPQNPSQSIAPPGMIVGLLALNHDLPTAARPKYLSPCDLAASPDSQYLYVAEQTAKRIAVVSLSTRTVIKEILLPNEVTGIAVAPDGLRLYAACSSDLWPNGMVCEVNIAAGKVTRRLPAGHGARSPVVSHDGKTLFVCNQYSNDVYVVDIASGTATAKIAVLREPYAAAITPDDSVLVVTNSLPIQKATDAPNIACKIILINTSRNEIDTAITLPAGSHSAFGVTISPDGKYAFATHLIATFTLPATMIVGGHIHSNNFAIVDIQNQKLFNDFPLDDADLGTANPWRVGCTKDNSILCVVHSGSNELSVVNMQAMLDSANAHSFPDTQYLPLGGGKIIKEDYSHDLSVLRAIKGKVSVAGRAPRALAIVGTRAYTAGYFGDSIEFFGLGLSDATTSSGVISLGPAQVLTSERQGEIAFCDGGLCFEKWQTCHSCHPFGRTDGLNWILGSDVIAPKNTKSLVYSWWTPPPGWSAKPLNSYETVLYSIRNLLFTMPDAAIIEKANNIDTFLMKLKPVPSPELVKGRLSEAAKRGKDVFLHKSKLDCILCHPGPLYTDRMYHNVGVDPYDANANWDTPSIVESWRSAPWGHLGLFDKIEEMMKDPKRSNASAILNEDEFKDLMAFVLSL